MSTPHNNAAASLLTELSPLDPPESIVVPIGGDVLVETHVCQLDLVGQYAGYPLYACTLVFGDGALCGHAWSDPPWRPRMVRAYRRPAAVA